MDSIPILQQSGILSPFDGGALTAHDMFTPTPPWACSVMPFHYSLISNNHVTITKSC